MRADANTARIISPPSQQTSRVLLSVYQLVMRLGILQYRSSPPKEVRVLHRTTHPPLKSEPTNVAEGLPLPFQALGQVGKTSPL